MDTFFSSNFKEAKEFLFNYLPIALPHILVFLILSFLFFKIPSKYFLFIYQKIILCLKVIFIKLKNIFINNKLASICFIIALIMLSINSKAYFRDETMYAKKWNHILKTIKKQRDEYLAQLKQLQEEIKNNIQSEYKLESKLNIPKVVFIIGESTQRNYMNLYGYGLNNTPNLNKLRDNNELFVFNDVISPHSHTNEALAKVLTFKNYETKKEWFETQNLIDLMKIAGYKTFWLSNQEEVSRYGNAQEAMSRRSDVLAYTDDRKMLVSKDYDGSLLKVYDNLNLVSQEKDFFIFHLYGTHGHYKQRYPKEFAKFSKEDVLNFATFELDNHQAQMVSEYVNAIYYNDFVVKEIIDRFKDEEAIIFYLSDHGDEVYNFRNFFGHTETMGSRFMVEVPFMIYLSPKLKQSNPELESKVKKAINLPFMSDDFIHSFLDLVGIDAQDLDLTRSMFSPTFNKNRVRIFNNKDYDKDLKSQNKFGFIAPSRLWLHRVDEIKKFNDFKYKYQNFEIDTHFLNGYFDVGHDGEAYSIGLNLEEMFKLAVNRNKELESKLDNPKNYEAKFWIDFKNLNPHNAESSLKEMLLLCKRTGFKKENLIIESSDYESLRLYKDAGFYTSYYVPYYNLNTMDSNMSQQIYANLRNIANSGNVNALSFDIYLYDFIKGANIDIDLLTWNAGKSLNENLWLLQYDLEVILVGEKGNYR